MPGESVEIQRGATLKEEDRKSSFDHATGGRFPGDFEVQSIFLTSPSFKDPEKIVDLSAVWTEINLFEDIYSPAISGDFTVVSSGLDLHSYMSTYSASIRASTSSTH